DGRQVRIILGDAERGGALGPAREVDVAARALLARRRLGQEAGPQSHGRRDLLDRELGVYGVIGSAHAAARGDIELEQSWTGLGVDGRKLDPQRFEGGHQCGDEPLKAGDLADAVAEPARQWPALVVTDANLVLERRPRLITQRR